MENCCVCENRFPRKAIRKPREYIRNVTLHRGLVDSIRQDEGRRSIEDEELFCCLACATVVYERVRTDPLIPLEQVEVEMEVSSEDEQLEFDNNQAMPHDAYDGNADAPNVAGSDESEMDSEVSSGDEEETSDEEDNVAPQIPRRCAWNFGPDSDLTDEEFYTMVGVNKDAFLTITNSVSPYMRISRRRTIENSVAMCLMKMRLGIPQSAIAVMFCIRVSQNNIRVLSLLNEYFVPNHLGYDHKTREDYITNHQTRQAEILMESQPGEAIVILDGTYIYIEKPSDHEQQKQVYSVHKHRPLVKAMMVVSTTGYILAIESCFFADSKNNDANIFANMTQDPNGFLTFFRENDLLVWDRGFRDVNGLARNLGFKPKMPHFLGRNQFQHTDIECNESRLVTKIRWICEAINGQIKSRFAFFRQTVSIKYVERLPLYLQLACAIINAFGEPMLKNTPENEKVANEMIARKDLVNLLYERLRGGGYLARKPSQWLSVIGADLEDFPILTEEDVLGITHGVYQIRQAQRYTERHLSNNSYIVRYHRDTPTIIRVDLLSRHTNKVTSCWVEYRQNGRDFRAILGWYCKCKQGMRTNGCCGHIASVIWYLGYARHYEEAIPPRERLFENTKDANEHDAFVDGV